MFDMKVCTDAAQRGVSTTNARTVGKVAARADVTIDPDADHVNASIWPGVSTRM
jgi:hypothetical protein